MQGNGHDSLVSAMKCGEGVWGKEQVWIWCSGAGKRGTGRSASDKPLSPVFLMGAPAKVQAA